MCVCGGGGGGKFGMIDHQKSSVSSMQGALAVGP